MIPTIFLTLGLGLSTLITVSVKAEQSNKPQSQQAQLFFETRENEVFILLEDFFSQFKMNPLENFLVESKQNLFSLLEFVNNKTPSKKVDDYDRVHHFGKWARQKQQGPDCSYSTRSLVLMRDSATPVTFDPEKHCTVVSGDWNEVYGNNHLTQAQDIQVDHMVPLKEAYESGAYKWTFNQRCLYGNYLGYDHHLLPVYGEENNNKGDQNPSGYLPSNKNHICTYLKDWVTIKALWGLSMTPEEAKDLPELINQYNCNKADFVISQEEIKKQQKFFNENISLCEGQVDYWFKK